MSACRTETQAYRKCLKDSRDSGKGGSSSNKCISIAQTLEKCRNNWRKANGIQDIEYDGTRTLPHHQCRPLNAKMQQCLKWKQGNELLCQKEIQAVKQCMGTTQGEISAATEGDKIWSDYKGTK